MPLVAQVDMEALNKELYLKSTMDLRYNLNKPYPEFTAKSIDGKEISLSDLKGKVVMINFWFANCPPCVAELGALNNLYEKYKDNSDFVYLSISIDPEDTIKKSITKHNIPYSVFSLSNEECGRLFARGFPTNAFLDKEGTLMFIKSGGTVDKKGVQPQVDDFESVIKQLLLL